MPQYSYDPDISSLSFKAKIVSFDFNSGRLVTSSPLTEEEKAELESVYGMASVETPDA